MTLDKILSMKHCIFKTKYFILVREFKNKYQNILNHNYLICTDIHLIIQEYIA